MELYLIPAERADELYHYGVKGMRWGHRKKYYNADGSLNRLGQARQNYKTANKAYNKSYDNAYNKSIGAYSPIKKHRQNAQKRWEDVYEKGQARDKAKKAYKAEKQAYKNSPEGKAAAEKRKKAIKAGAAVAGTALAAYGAYKASKWIKNKHVELSVERGRKEAVDIIKQMRPFDKDSTRKVYNRELRTELSNLESRGFKVSTTGRDPFSGGARRRAAEAAKAYDKETLNYYSQIYDKKINKAKQTAQADKFSTAAKDVYQYYKKKRKK